MKQIKVRATATKSKGSEVGIVRFNTYKRAISQIKKSIDAKFYLEAITLIESLIADRLESRLKYLITSDEYSFNPLGTLINGIRKNETNEELIKLCITKVDDWRNKRNDALHAMSKLENDNLKEWNKKIEECRITALEGEQLRKEIFTLIEKLKKEEK